jgi:hypothetical protein
MVDMESPNFPPAVKLRLRNGGEIAGYRAPVFALGGKVYAGQAQHLRGYVRQRHDAAPAQQHGPVFPHAAADVQHPQAGSQPASRIEEIQQPPVVVVGSVLKALLISSGPGVPFFGSIVHIPPPLFFNIVAPVTG